MCVNGQGPPQVVPGSARQDAGHSSRFLRLLLISSGGENLEIIHPSVANNTCFSLMKYEWSALCNPGGYGARRRCEQ